MSIVPVFQVQDLQRTNGTNKVQKATYVINNEVLWASGAIQSTQLKMILAFSTFLFNTEEEARIKRDEILKSLIVIETPNEKS